jgi:membrane-associated protein
VGGLTRRSAGGPYSVAVDLLHPDKLIEAFGTIGLFLIIFAESGLFFGFFLPGDSLLFTAGVLCAKADSPLWPFPIVVIGVAVAAIAGDQVGYVFGRRVGPSLFRRPDSRLFRQAHVDKARNYFEEHGPKTIFLARFVPIVRTFAPIVAGVGRMEYRTFVTYNVVGGLVWAVGITTLGYLLGEAVDIDKYLLPVVGIIIVVSVIPVLLEIRKAKREQAEPVPVPEAGSVER